MLIRDARLEDAAAISKLVSECVREQISPTLSDAGTERLLSEMTPPAIECYLRGDFQFFLVEFDGTLAGVCGVKLPSHLYHFFVRRDFQRRGLGRRLWIHARDWILDHGTSATITVNSSLNAVAVYERLGFSKDGVVAEKNNVRCQPMCWSLAGENVTEHE